MNMLPDLLRIRPNGLQPQQLEVYEEFGKPKLTQSVGPVVPTCSSILPISFRSPADNVLTFPFSPSRIAVDGRPRSGLVERAVRAASGSYRTASPVSEAAVHDIAPSPTSSSNILSSDQAVAKFAAILSDLERLFAASNAPSFTALPPAHDIRVAIRQIPILAAQSFNRDETALAFSQKIVQHLYKSESPLGREVYVIILQRLCELFSKVQKEVTTWLIYAQDEARLLL
jgi:CCR4-NOT transcription complex subunit 1